MIDTLAIERLDDEAQLVLFVFVFLGVEESLSSGLVEGTMKRAGVQLSKKWTCNMLCKQLCNEKILICDSKSGYKLYATYRLADQFLPSAIARLLEISIERNWWMIFGYNETKSGVNHSSSIERARWKLLEVDFDCTEKAFQMRQLLSGALLDLSIEGLSLKTSAQWKVCAALPKLVFFDAPEPLRLKFDKGTPLAVFFKLMAVLLTRNASVEWLLEQIANAAREKIVVFSEPQYCEFVSYCILCGHAEWIDGVMKSGTDAGAFAQLPAALRAGDLAAANSICSRVDKAVDLGRLDCPASNILALLVSLFAHPALTRAAKYMRAIAPNPNWQNYRNSEGENREIESRSAIYDSVCDGLDREARNDGENVNAFDFTHTLGVLVQTILNGMNKNDSARIVQRMLTSAEHITEMGYPTLAGAYLSVFGWALPEDEKERVDALVKRIADEGGVWFRPFLGVALSWQRIVDVLNERLPKKVAKKSADSGKVKSGRIIWGIEGDAGGEKLQPLFRGPRGADDGSDDKRLTVNVLLGGKYDNCMTDADKAVVAALRKSKHVGTKDNLSLSADLFAALCGLDNVVNLKPGAKAKSFVEKPLRVVRRDIPLSAKSKKDGGLTLTVPEWATQRNRLYFVRKPQPDCYEFYPIDRDKAPLLDVFREYGNRGTIMLPKEAMAKVRPLLGRIAALIPLQGDLANAAGESGLKRVAGEATPLVRLSMEDGTLAIALRVRPMAEAKTVVCEPGAGQAERTVALAEGAAVLVRDLAEEKRRAEEVEAALADCESWREGRLDWVIDEPGAALVALSAVRGLGEKAHVEWQPGKKISLMKPSRRLALGATLGADHWLTVNGDCELDDGRVVTLLKLLSRFGERIGRFVPIDENGYVELSRPLLRTLEALETAGRESRGKLLVSPAALPMLDTTLAEGGAEIALPKTMQVETERVRSALSGRYAAPEHLKAVLRPYQESGYEWLARLAACGLGSCLADDMGLGKTVQIIALLLARAADGASLVIAPTSVAGNWRGEIRRFAPTLNPIVAGEGGDGNWLKADAHDVVIVSYGLLVSRSAKFLSREWNGVVLDEAQAIKNAVTERAKTVKKLAAKFRIAATGTPVENRLTDLWSVFDFLNPGLLGTEEAFTGKFTDGGRATPALKNLVRPLVLRRLKRDVLDDLPEKTEITLSVPLEGDERAGYEACRIAALDTLEKGGKENRISILAELMRLRRYCCHPSLVLPEVVAGAKLEALMELLRDLKGANHRVLVFSQFTDFLAIVQARVKQEGLTFQYLDGATPPQERERRVAAFQRGEGDLFLMSLKAGGTGLNLTAANYVVLLDPWWNPAVEDQAADRAHRIGQRNPVTVYRLIAADTVEERVLELHREKKDLARDVLDGTGSTALTPEALMKLFT